MQRLSALDLAGAGLVIGLVCSAFKDHGPVVRVAKMAFILDPIVAGVQLTKARGEPA